MAFRNALCLLAAAAECGGGERVRTADRCAQGAARCEGDRTRLAQRESLHCLIVFVGLSLSVAFCRMTIELYFCFAFDITKAKLAESARLVQREQEMIITAFYQAGRKLRRRVRCEIRSDYLSLFLTRHRFGIATGEIRR